MVQVTLAPVEFIPLSAFEDQLQVWDGGSVGVHPRGVARPAPRPLVFAGAPPRTQTQTHTSSHTLLPLLQVNLVGAMRVTQAFLPLLRGGERPGRIVNMSSQVEVWGLTSIHVQCGRCGGQCGDVR